MPIPAGLLTRPMVRTLVGLGIVAVLLGRGASRPAVYRPPRQPAPPRYHVFSSHLFPAPPYTPRILDTETGVITPLVIPGDEDLDDLSCSPWRDGEGRYHLAGCWKSAAGPELHRLARAFGVAQVTFPVARASGGLPLDPLMFGAPCWFPDRSDRILFAAGDGRLYRYTFSGGEGSEAEAAAPPRPLRWEVGPSGIGAAPLRDPCWPSGPALGGRLLVAALRPGDRRDAPWPSRGSRLCWLQLSPDSEAIVAAGHLIIPAQEEPAEARGEERWPGVGMTRDGVPMLAYLARPAGLRPWELWLAPIAVGDEAAGRPPRVRATAARRLVATCAPTAPAFSPDGRWVYAMVRVEGSGAIHLARFAVATGADDCGSDKRSPSPGA